MTMRESLQRIYEKKIFEILTNENRLERLFCLKKLYRRWISTNFTLRESIRLPCVEVSLVGHCNLSCRGCNAYSPLSKPIFLEIAAYKHDVIRLNQLFDKIDEIYLLGGEPLLHPKLLEILSLTRSVLQQSTIVLVTNGILLAKAPKEFWIACFRNHIIIRISGYPIEIDIKTILTTAESYGVIVVVHPIKKFFKFSKNLNGNSEPKEMFLCCREYVCNSLQGGRIFPCGIAAKSPTLTKYFSVDLPLCDMDSIDIHSDVSGKEILSFLEKPIPWCRFCTSERTTFNWRPSDKMLEEWI